MGLRAYPWLQDYRSTERKERPGQPVPFDCTPCRENNSEATRRAMGCGWMSLTVDDETGEPVAAPQVWQHAQDPSDPPLICPGYTTALPDVIDIATAYPHHEKGNLAVYFPEGCSRALMDGFAEMDRSIAMFINKPPVKS